MKNFLVILLVLVLSIPERSSAQDPLRFKDQVKALKQKQYNFPEGEEVLLFVGSSSVRMWKDVQKLSW